MRGQYLGDLVDANNLLIARVWSNLDSDRRVGHSVLMRPSENLANVVAMHLTGENQFELRPSRWHEQIWDKLIEPVAEDFAITGTWQMVPTATVHGIEASLTTSSATASRYVGTLKLAPMEPVSSQPNRVLNTWTECKQWMDSHMSDGPSLYRGQSHPYPLTTSFHRMGRVDLFRYLFQDLKAFTEQASAVAGQDYNFNDLTQRGRVVGLAQHHGFPTPMLDWTWSPYIAAYFAFSGIVGNKLLDDHRVRLFRLLPPFVASYGDLDAVLNHVPVPMVRLWAPPSFGNTRMLSQQGVFLFSSVSGPETLIRQLEASAKLQFLEIADVPASECRTALRDLRRMGITAASMFPGLDGVCAALKHERFLI